MGLFFKTVRSLQELVAVGRVRLGQPPVVFLYIVKFFLAFNSNVRNASLKADSVYLEDSITAGKVIGGRMTGEGPSPNNENPSEGGDW